ncbi:MAG: MBL fold metallo-hydrolase [Clostridia bacterium]|nr:MBL fold metallo-hydrolase [Clostridia bacterium]
MKITRLGQAGLLFETARTTVLADPYFSDSAFAVSGVHRKKEVPERAKDIRPDLLLLTHDHIDHYDPETVQSFVNASTRVTVLSPDSVWRRVRELGGDNNFVRMEPGVTWTEKDVTVTALTARHSDPYAIGFALEAEGLRILITGDTLLDLDWRVPAGFERPDFLFLPINGRGNNMNAADAAKLARALNAKHAVPVHYGMLDDCSPDAFDYEGKAVLEDGVEYDIQENEL